MYLITGRRNQLEQLRLLVVADSFQSMIDNSKETLLEMLWITSLMLE